MLSFFKTSQNFEVFSQDFCGISMDLFSKPKWRKITFDDAVGWNKVFGFLFTYSSIIYIYIFFIFKSYIDKGMVSRIYKKFLQLKIKDNKKARKSIKKWTKNLDRYLSRLKNI